MCFFIDIFNGSYKVYVHTNLTNGKMYIGITCQNPRKRWDYGHGYEYNGHFWNAIKKYGWHTGFSHEIFADHLTQEEACNMERLLIKEFHTNDPEYGYNMDEGGGLPPVMRGEENPFYGNHSLAGENHPMWGKKHTDETRKLMSEHHRDCSGGKNPNARSVKCLETGIVYDCINSAAANTPCARESIRLVAHGIRESTKGFHWVFV